MTNLDKLLEITNNVYYINLEKSVERNEQFRQNWSNAEQMNKLIRIDAVSPLNSYEKVHNAINSNRQLKYVEPYRIISDRKQKLNEACCAMSQSKALMHALYSAKEFFEQHPHEYEYIAIIAEDDAKITDAELDFNFHLDIQREKFDILQLGYTVFTNDLSTWLVNREYCIDAKLTSNCNFASYTSGVLGALCYMIRITQTNFHEFQALADELASGVIGDYCVSTRIDLNKKIYKEKLASQTDAESTISQTAIYDEVHKGCLVNLFDTTLVKGFDFFDSMSIYVKRDKCSNKCMFYYVALDKFNNVIDSKHRTAFDYQNISMQIEQWKDICAKEASENAEIEKAYVVLFTNKLRPNLGDKQYVKGASSWNTELITQ